MGGVDCRVRLDNVDVRVTEFRLSPGARINRGRRTCDVVSVFLTGGSLRGLGAECIRHVSPGEIVALDARSETLIANVGDEPVELVEIDLKWTERRLISG